MRINQATIELIQEFEGCRLEAYQDSAGYWTIGWGHAETSGIPPIPKRGMVITQAEADALFMETLERFADRIRPMFKREATPNQFGAMLSLAYNIGTGAFGKSTCLKRFNAGDIEGAAEALTWFNKAGGKVLRGLVRRREAERALFLTDSPVSINEGSGVRPDAPKTPTGSTTVWGTIVAGFSTVGAVFTAIGELDPIAQALVIGLGGLVILALIWIARERIRKMGDGV